MVKRTLRPYNCANCANEFWTWKYHQKYCGRSCARKAVWSSGAMERVRANLATYSLFKKGFTPWNKNRPWPEHIRKKMGKNKSREAFMSVRGGNGKGMSKHEEMLSKILVKGWIHNFVVAVGMGRGNGFPTHYKIDFAWPKEMIALEVDGSSHSDLVRQASDRRKELFLAAHGWSVYRIKNAEVALMSSTSRSKVRPSTLRKVA